MAYNSEGLCSRKAVRSHSPSPHMPARRENKPSQNNCSPEESRNARLIETIVMMIPMKSSSTENRKEKASK